MTPGLLWVSNGTSFLIIGLGSLLGFGRHAKRATLFCVGKYLS